MSAPFASRPLRSVTKEAIAELLEAELLSGSLPPGTRLPPERQLSERYGVSRPVMREVLQILAERGLIESSPGRGTFAREARLADIARPLDVLYRRQRPTPRAVVQARRTLERETAFLAAQSATADDLTALQEALGQFDAARDVMAQAQADIKFHAAVARASHNPVLEIMFGSISGLAHELMLRSLGDPTVSREGVPYHQEIFKAIKAKRPEAARRAMEGHLQVSLRLYGSDLDESLDVVARRKLEELLGQLQGHRRVDRPLAVGKTAQTPRPPGPFVSVGTTSHSGRLRTIACTSADHAGCPTLKVSNPGCAAQPMTPGRRMRPYRWPRAAGRLARLHGAACTLGWRHGDRAARAYRLWETRGVCPSSGRHAGPVAAPFAG